MRGPMSEETKKKISEALKKGTSAIMSGTGKGGSSEIEKKYGKEGVQLLKDFDTAKASIEGNAKKVEESKAVIDGLKAQAEGADKETKKKIKEQIKVEREKVKAIKAEMKAQRETIQGIKKKAAELKRVAKAKAALEKAAVKKQKLGANKIKLDGAKTKVADAQKTIERELKREKDPEKLKKLQDKQAALSERMVRINEMETRHGEAERNLDDNMLRANQVIKNKGVVSQDFNLLNEMGGHVHLAENTKLVALDCEKKVNLELLAETFDSLEATVTNELKELTNAEIERVANKVESHYSDLAALSALTFYIFGKVKSSINAALKKGFEVGKKSVAAELKSEVPKTPQKNIQMMNFEADNVADAYVSELENETKSLTASMVASGVTASAAALALRRRLKAKADLMIANISMGVVPQSIGRGRQLSLFENPDKVLALQRSETLDSRTCPTCFDFHGKTIKPDDPFASLNLVHTRCRGIWVPLEAGEFEIISGVPARISSAFETFGGVPLMNNFKQLKKPLP